MAKIFIATPMYGGQCTGVYVQSLLGLVGALTQAGHQTICNFMFNESLIQRARNNLAYQFLKGDADYLFWIDADIKFRPQDVIKMLEADVDLIGGLYPKKEINWASVKDAVSKGKDNLQNFTGSFVVNTVGYKDNLIVPVDQPLEVYAIGTGFMLVKRKVFEEMREYTEQYSNDMSHMPAGEKIYNFFQVPVCPETNRLLSEDYFFCKHYRDHGGKVYAAPWCQLGHMGTYLFEGQLVSTEEPCNV